jgi:glycosyltransferase involved in cell wall biosynthesis
MKKLNFACPINDSGYGVASFNILKELSNYYNLAYLAIGQPSVSTQEQHDELISILKKSVSPKEVDINAPYLKIWHQFDLGDHFGRGKYYAYPFFELDTFNDAEKIHLSVPDVIFVTSTWAKEVMINNGIKSPIEVVPLGVDIDVFNYQRPKTTDNNNYIFLTIGKWEIRKSHDIIPRLFKKAFPNEQDVELWILAAEHTSSYSKEEEIKQWKNLYSSSNVKIIPGVKTHTDVANIIANSNCGLYISRAEGWNLELLETMAMNKPSIVTNYSSHTEFCNKENSYLVDIHETEKANDGKAFHGQGNWAKIGPREEDQIIEYMRYCYNNQITTNQNGLKTAQTYSWKNSADKIFRCIN